MQNLTVIRSRISVFCLTLDKCPLLKKNDQTLRRQLISNLLRNWLFFRKMCNYPRSAF